MSALIVLILRLLLMVILFAFLFWVVFTLWRDLLSTSSLVHTLQIPALNLHLLENNVLPDKILSVPEGIIGRDPICEIQLDNETVSARHARLRFHHKQWWIEDLLSTNGTFLNDEAVITPTVLISGDELRCGQQKMLITIEKKNGS
jgi:predicted component of type VI protein secretion system